MLQVGKILKSNGIDGGILVNFREVDPDDIQLTEPVFIYFDGLPVPFFIRDLSKKGYDKAVVHLNDVETLKDAEEIVGQGLFMDESLFEDEPQEDDFSALVGWTVKGVGKVLDFIDIPANPCLEVDNGGKAVMIPVNEDFIVSVDPDRMELEMDLPEGLLDL